MWDGWEAAHGCTRRELADLVGYCRVFNKVSIKNWGTRDAPCPTLNLSKSMASVCRGIAFEFPENNNKAVLTELIEREGRGFELLEMSVLLQGTTKVSAVVPVYEGNNIISGKKIVEVASLVAKAIGTKGSCSEYIKNIAEKLAELNIDDPLVTEFCVAVKADTLDVL